MTNFTVQEPEQIQKPTTQVLTEVDAYLLQTLCLLLLLVAALGGGDFVPLSPPLPPLVLLVSVLKAKKEKPLKNRPLHHS